MIKHLPLFPQREEVWQTPYFPQRQRSRSACSPPFPPSFGRSWGRYAL